MRPPRDAEDHISFLYGLQKYGMKLGLRGTRRLARLAGDPHLRFPSVHIAGSNGKGSVAAMLASVLSSAGYKTGLYTSPHLIDFRERIRIDGREIPVVPFVNLMEMLRPHIERHRTTFFESTTILAFRHFAESKVDIAVVEVGLGGRLDATNILTPLVSSVTSISREHAAILGNKLNSIAREKGGIIKKGVPVVLGRMAEGPRTELLRIAGQRSAPVVSGPGVRIQIHRESLAGSRFSVNAGGVRARSIDLPLPGRHQIWNAVTVLQIIGVLRERYGYHIGDRDIASGLSSVRERTGFRGRLTPAQGSSTMLIDVAHNPESVRATVDTLKRYGRRNAIVVFGVMKDKEYESMIRLLAGVTGFCIAVEAQTERALPVAAAVSAFRRNGVDCVGTPFVSKGVKMARALAGRGDTIVILGSHFVVGEALAFLEGRKYLTINQ